MPNTIYFIILCHIALYFLQTFLDVSYILSCVFSYINFLGGLSVSSMYGTYPHLFICYFYVHPQIQLDNASTRRQVYCRFLVRIYKGKYIGRIYNPRFGLITPPPSFINPTPFIVAILLRQTSSQIIAFYKYDEKNMMQ